MIPTKLAKAASAKAEVEDFMQHLGWAEHIAPVLEAYKRNQSDALVGAVLGESLVTVDGVQLSKEQIAGRIAGIMWLEKVLAQIIRHGKSAEEALKIQYNVVG